MAKKRDAANNPAPAEPVEGWGLPAASRKHHYFVDGRSLCGKWAFGGGVDDPFDTEPSPDNCAGCARALTARVAALAKA